MTSLVLTWFDFCLVSETLRCLTSLVLTWFCSYLVSETWRCLTSFVLTWFCSYLLSEIWRSMISLVLTWFCSYVRNLEMLDEFCFDMVRLLSFFRNPEVLDECDIDDKTKEVLFENICRKLKPQSVKIRAGTVALFLFLHGWCACLLTCSCIKTLDTFVLFLIFLFPLHPRC